MTLNALTPFADFLVYLREPSPFRLRRGQAVDWPDRERHDSAWQQDPELYALAGLSEDTADDQQAAVLFQVLRRSWAGLPESIRETCGRIVRVLLQRLSTERVLTVLLALRRERANHKHVTRAILGFLLDHPDLERLAGRCPHILVDLIEHALGRNTVRGIVKQLVPGSPPAEEARALLRWTRQPEWVVHIVRALYHKEALPRVPASAGPARSSGQPESEEENFVAPKTVTATNRGDIAATLVHLYRGGDSPELHQALERYVERAARDLPRFHGRLTLVLDASASTRGYGEREYCCIAQSQALRLVLQRCCADLRVHTVGGTGGPPRPEGATDLATALLDALEEQPDVVAVVTDGYENLAEGDLARVAAALPAAGCDVPVIFCQSQFTHKDDLSMRQPAPRLPALSFWHEVDFAPLLRRLFASAAGKTGPEYLREHLRWRLEKMETEVPSWLCPRLSPNPST
jgi:hypothetical protein